MNTVIDWLPYLGAALTLLIGLTCFFKPQLLLNVTASRAVGAEFASAVLKRARTFQ